MNNFLTRYQTIVADDDIDKKVRDITANITSIYNVQNIKKIFAGIDLIYLNITDNDDSIKKFAEKVSLFNDTFADMPNVAAVCIYPLNIRTLKQNLTAENVNISTVTGGFPTSQTFIEIKTAEIQRAVAEGADEIETVISAGALLSKNYDTVFDEISQIRAAANNVKLKVIIETGILENLSNIKTASLIALEAGADFIKTSTGRVEPSATLNSVYTIAVAVKEYYEKTGRKAGIMPSGSISEPDTALKYFTVIKNVLGDEWLNPQLFRIGATNLANNLLTTINKMTSEENRLIKYF